jgi:outer membrane protein assembly factor BamB
MRLSSLILTVLFVAPVAGADWPQWRGPNRDGHSADTNLLEEWPKEGPKLLWSVKDAKTIGAGYGQPAVVGDRLLVVGASGARQGSTEFVTCLKVKDGEKAWQTELPSTPGRYTDGWGGGPRSTPTGEGDRVYVLGVTGDLVCLSADKGEIKWKKNLVKDFGGRIPGWGYSESPLVDGDQVVCTPGGGGGMVALD